MSKKQKQQIRDLYPQLKSDGMFNMVLGSCISSDNEDTKERWQSNKHLLEELLSGIPPTEANDIKLVKQGIEIVERQLEKF